MRTLKFLLSLLLIFNYAFAQQKKTNASYSTCEPGNLSNNFKYATKIFWARNDFDMPFAEKMEVIVTSKGDKTQLIAVESAFMAVLFDSFSCTHARSYFTGTNAEEAVIDNNWGNFIVRDFNFDGLEDFAIKVADNNVGSLYAYYVQSDGKFERQNYLSDNVGLMMDSFDISTRRAYRSAAAGCCKMIHYTYQYEQADSNWMLIKTEEEDLTTD